ncbi:unnamed protein product [Brassica rapa]|uniref:Uncharacterized protein n=1 Tax=Brassica campestris TaxID=3711 RepID=A0A3P6A490_BRACM|nr:unnamed protein product [Brassica rapa]VDC79491.1 unnamed protein product [Brassica rapa]
MEEELRNLVKVCISVLISISYCYYISSKIPKGFVRLLSLLPIFIIFLLIPLFFSSLHFCAISAFFLTWLANFKLLLFAFDQEPLSPLPSSFSRFLCSLVSPSKPNKTLLQTVSTINLNGFLRLKLYSFPPYYISTVKIIITLYLGWLSCLSLPSMSTLS